MPQRRERADRATCRLGRAPWPPDTGPHAGRYYSSPTTDGTNGHTPPSLLARRPGLRASERLTHRAVGDCRPSRGIFGLGRVAVARSQRTPAPYRHRAASVRAERACGTFDIAPPAEDARE